MSEDGSNRCVLLIGAGPLADATKRALEAGGAAVRRLEEPSDPEIREALDDRIDRVVVISRYDHVSLRLALVVAHVRPGTPSLVTIFDRDVARQLQDAVDNVRVLSMADLVAASFAGPLLDPDVLSVTLGEGGMIGIKASGDAPEKVARTWSTPGRLRRLLAVFDSIVRPFDTSARILVAGLAGFLAVLVLETLVTTVFEHRSLVDSFYYVAKVAVTVGPSPAADTGEAWFKVFSAVTMLLTLGFAAVLTAGIVNRLLDQRLTGIVGRAAVPHRDHVIVVGLGQVGFRLAMLLRDLGVPVVVVERNKEAKNVTRAKDVHLPVVIGSGGSQRLLRRLSIDSCRALAAVTSDEVENIAIAVAGRGLNEELSIALRAGDGDATSETASLFKIGIIRDVYRIAGTALAATALGYDTHAAFPHEGTMYLIVDDGKIVQFEPISSEVPGRDGPSPSRGRPPSRSGRPRS